MFSYTTDDDTFASYNPTDASEPLFLEKLLDNFNGTAYLDEIKTNCTNNGNGISRTCVFDLLVTNRTSVGVTSLQTEEQSNEIENLVGMYNLIIFICIIK